MHKPYLLIGIGQNFKVGCLEVSCIIELAYNLADVFFADLDTQSAGMLHLLHFHQLFNDIMFPDLDPLISIQDVLKCSPTIRFGDLQPYIELTSDQLHCRAIAYSSRLLARLKSLNYNCRMIP